MVILSSYILLITLFILPNLFIRYVKIDNVEKPIYSIGIIVLILNIFYFNFGLPIKYVFILVLLLFILSMIFTLKNFSIVKYDISKFFYISFPLLILFELIYIIYGEQFYIFRGNQQDAFVYTSLGLSFFNYLHHELLIFKDSFPTELQNDYYLKHSLNLIYYRPSVGLVIAFFKNFSISNIFFDGFIFKIVCSLCTLFSLISFFDLFKIKFRNNLIFSNIFILSFFYFYNFEIDAYSLILSLPFFILILKYSINIHKLLENFDVDLIKYIFLWSLFFIIYPNGAAVAMPPTAILILITFVKNKFQFNHLKNIIFSIVIFIIIVGPTYKSTLFYLYQEIIVGLFHDPDYWGYYGAFVFGKDNPIRDPLVVNKIKLMMSENYQLIEVFKEVISLNFEKNSNVFFLNILPSAFGYFHLTTKNSSVFNIPFIFTLIVLNIFLLKRIFKNFVYLYKNKDDFSFLVKYYLIYFILFFLFLLISGNIWSSIKLYFMLAPLFYFLILFDFSKSKIKPKITIFLVILIFLPFYKYSSFNNGIGIIDSFPSIIHLSNKQETDWQLNREKLYKCNDLIYDVENKSEKIFISIVFNEKMKKIKKTDCIISKEKNKFKLKIM